jgi:pimeloyl-ACP methyl ester carboxylesterase
MTNNILTNWDNIMIVQELIINTMKKVDEIKISKSCSFITFLFNRERKMKAVIMTYRVHVSAAIFWIGVVNVSILLLCFIPLFFILSALIIIVIDSYELFFSTSSRLRSFPTEEELTVLEDKIIATAFSGKAIHILKDIAVTSLHEDTVKAHALYVKSQSVATQVSTIVLIHGTGASAACWIESFEHLSKQFHVLALDLPGFGRSKGSVCPLDTNTTINFYGEFIHSFLNAMELETVYVLAHSYGAFLAVHFAEKYPQQVSHLMLCDAVGIFPTLSSTGARWAFVFKTSLLQSCRFMGSVGTRAFFAWFSVLQCSADYYYWYSVLSSPSGWGDKNLGRFITLGWTKAFWNQPAIDHLVQLSRLNVPVATVYGELDDIIPSHQGEVLWNCMGIPFSSIKNAGHSPIHCADVIHLVGIVSATFQSSNQLDTDQLCSSQQTFRASSLFNESENWKDIYSSSFSTVHTQQIIERFYTDIYSHSRFISDSTSCNPQI